MDSQRISRFTRKWFAEWGEEPICYGRASQILDHLINERPDEAWVRILALIAQARAESLGYIGAGPLEDLLCEHGRAMLERIEAAAANDPRFATCLSAVWGHTRFEPFVYAQVQRIVHGSKA